MARFNLWALMLVLLLCTVRPAHAAESYDNCTGFITSLPAVITTQGTWCLKQDLATAITNGNAITINTNNVTIDCNNFKLGGLAAGAGTATIGIFAQDRVNETVRNCNIRGFRGGVDFAGAAGGGHAVEDNRFDGNTLVGLQVEGDGSVVQRNRVSDTGGSTAASDAYGIFAGNSTDVLNNTVSGVIATAGANGSAYGIYTNESVDSSVSGNRVRRLLKDGVGLAYGIYNLGSDRVTLTDNHVIGAGNLGLRCYQPTGRARDNVINGFVTGLENCTDDGNVIAP